MLYHNSHDPLYREPIGAVKAGETLTVRFHSDEGDVTLRVWDGSEHFYPMQQVDEHLYEATVTMPREPMLLWYDFQIQRAGDLAFYGTSADELGGEGAYCAHQPRSYQVTVYQPDYATPEYLRHGVVYQIFPDRFFKDKNGQKGRVRKIAAAHPDATFHESWDEKPTLDIDPENNDNRALDFFGGTLRGIKQKLDYLQELGVSVLYLNPIFRSHSNHRYDTGDYQEIDPIVGDDKSFDELIAAAKARGMRVMLDGVFSHTGSDSKYFNRYGRYDTVGAYQSEESPYASWYEFDEFPNKYRTWWGFHTLPAVNKDEPTYRDYLLNPDNGVLPGWVKRGACGWRLDVVDELPVDMVREMRAAVKQANPDSTLLGEVWEDASNKISYGVPRSYCLGDMLDSVMNYPLRRAVIDFFTGKIDAKQLSRVILHQQEVYPAPFYYSLMNLLGSHDRVRILNAMAGYDREGAIQMDRAEAEKITLGKRELKSARKRYVEAMKLLCALPGAPTVYYGDEIGMTGMADPWNRAPMAWDSMDETLHDEIAALLNKRKESAMLQTGWMKLEVVDADTLRITRYAKDGADVFGEPLEGKDVSVRISRK